jgi:hypothetical protein
LGALTSSVTVLLPFVAAARFGSLALGATL